MNKNKTVMAGIMFFFVFGFLFINGMAAQQVKTPAVAKIDLNKATAEQLSKCPGITSALAKAIVEYREKSGPFKAPEELLKVKGITNGILDKIKPKMEKNILYVLPAAPDNDDDDEPNLKPSKC
jgi:competence protein ComEA